MALRQIRIGAVSNAAQYDDADFDSAFETDQPIRAGTPIDSNDVVRLSDVTSSVVAFLAKPSVDQLNIATGASVTVVLGTEIFDQGGNFAANVFTAPVTGKYQLSAFVELHDLDQAASWYRLNIVTSNRTYLVIMDPTQFAGDIPEWSLSLSILADMDASDTAHISIYQNGGAAQTDIIAAGTYFSGFRAC